MWIEILLFFALLFLYVYRYVTGSFDEFKKIGVPYAQPSFPFGSSNAKKMLMGETNFFDGDKLLAENEFKNAQKSTKELNTGKLKSTLKAMSKKQLRKIKKTRMNSKTGVLEYVSAYAK